MDGQQRSSLGDASQIRVVGDADLFRETLRRLPLAEAVLHLLGYALHEKFLAECFERNRGQCYEDKLTFADLVEILTDALLVHHGSARQALLEAEKKNALPVCKRAFYSKLARLPLDLSVAFLTEASRRLNELLPKQTNPLPASLHGYQVRIIDGKKTKHVAKRLKLTRTQAGQLFGSKLLVGYDPATRLIQAVSAHADGEKKMGRWFPICSPTCVLNPAKSRRSTWPMRSFAIWCRSRFIARKTSILPCVITPRCIFMRMQPSQRGNSPTPRNDI